LLDFLTPGEIQCAYIKKMVDNNPRSRLDWCLPPRVGGSTREESCWCSRRSCSSSLSVSESDTAISNLGIGSGHAH
jgi:hypothetical protein